MIDADPLPRHTMQRRHSAAPAQEDEHLCQIKF